MIIETKYSLGDFVYPIRGKTRYKRIPKNCSVCKDTGKVELDTKLYTCPKCNGYTYDSEEDGIEWIVSECDRSKIGRVGTTFYRDKYKSRNYKDEIRYMIDSTGVGSGTLWNEDELFLTLEEAQAECDKRNSREIVESEKTEPLYLQDFQGS